MIVSGERRMNPVAIIIINSGKEIHWAGYKNQGCPIPYTSVSSVPDLRTGGRWFEPQAPPAFFFVRIDESNCNRIHSSITRR